MAGSSAKLQEVYFSELAAGKKPVQAAAAANVNMRVVNEWRRIYPDFVDREEQALKEWRTKHYTKENVEEFLRCLLDGNKRSTAAKHIGINLKTLDAWMVDHPDFERRVLKAEALVESRSVKKIAESDDPKVQLEYIARRFPENWAKNEKIKVEMVNSLTAEEIEAVLNGDLDIAEVLANHETGG